MPVEAVRAWIYDDASKADPRAPHMTNPVQWVSRETLDRLGVLQWSMDNPSPEHPELVKVRAARNYKGHDFVTISREKLPNYDQKLKDFFDEHLHEDEEIRYILQGSGYFDVRHSFDSNECWVRIEVKAGHMIVLPAGVYHRFTLDETNFIHVMRLFQDLPVWTAWSRNGPGGGVAVTEAKPARAVYKKYITQQAEAAKLAVAKAVVDPSLPGAPAVGAGAGGAAAAAAADSKGAGADVKAATHTGANGTGYIVADGAKSLANYPHVRAAGGLLYVSGLSSRRPDNTHRGATQNADGTWALDIAEQTRGVIENMRLCLSAAGADLSHVIDLTCFLTDMKHYAGFNAAYNSYFDAHTGPTRTTVAVKELPHPRLLVEIKAVAIDPKAHPKPAAAAAAAAAAAK